MDHGTDEDDEIPSREDFYWHEVERQFRNLSEPEKTMLVAVAFGKSSVVLLRNTKFFDLEDADFEKHADALLECENNFRRVKQQFLDILTTAISEKQWQILKSEYLID